MHQYLDLGLELHVPLYNLLIGIGAILGFLHLEKEMQRYHVPFRMDRNIYLSIVISIVLGFCGAKFFELFYHHLDFTMHNFFAGGITFMGGVVTAGVSFFFINLILKTDNVLAFNILIPFVIIGHFFGRIGCFMAGCCYGKPTDCFLGVVFPEGSLPAQHYGKGVALHPTQLYEVFFLGLLFLFIKRKVEFKYRLSVYLISYGFFRFCVEFLRADDRGVLFTDLLSPSQVMGIVFCVMGIVFILYNKEWKRRGKSRAARSSTT